MSLIILITALLIVAVLLAVLLYKTVTRLEEENSKLKERVYRLRNSRRQYSSQATNETIWRPVAASDLVDRIKDRDFTVLN